MLGFTPFKRHANRFNYIPRYYDPAKEAREQRRAELRGERAEESDREYRPGQYVRTQREARRARRTHSGGASRTRVWKLVAGAAAVLLFILLLYPRLTGAFLRTRTAPVTAGASDAPQAGPRDAFDQSGVSDVEWQEQRIVVVPDDYEE